jgi:hypothetical protein
MKKIFGLIGLIVVISVIGSLQAVSASGSDSFWIDQGGATTEVTPLVSLDNDLSNYSKWISVVGGFSQNQTSFVFLHNDLMSGELSLGFVQGKVDGGPNILAGTATIDVTGLPDGSSLAFSDDSTEFVVNTALNEAHGTWLWWDCCTDGGAVVLGDSNIDVAVDASFGTIGILPITEWVFLSGDGSTVSLDQLKTLNINSPNKSQVLSTSGVGGKGLTKAPGLDKKFNPTSNAADNAGKKN